MDVRPATPADCLAMARLIAEVAQEGFLGAEPPVDIATRAKRYKQMLEAQGAGGVWVLEHDGRVVGKASVVEPNPGVLRLGMAVGSEARGQGGGRALLEAVVAHARRRGCHKLDLEAWIDNGRAIAFYTSNGFEVEGVRRKHYRRRDGTLRSSLIMARLLDL
jgi:putative acetyltransferase